MKIKNESLSDDYQTSYAFEKFPLVVLSEGNGRTLKPKPNCLKHEYLKQLTLMRSRYAKPCELPYSVDVGYDSVFDDCDAIRNYESLCMSGLSKEQYQEYAREVDAIDFRIFDAERNKRIVDKYKAQKLQQMASAVDFDTMDMLQEED